ncbi:hypothetical protein [Sphingobacterium sp. MYb388]|uniref:hypothetical protein n=1 Tax=Sphingobacterium sp. MYb388 TaxID=2745437 RepID=UPI0030A3E74B
MMKHKFAVKASLFTLILALIAFGTYATVAVMKKDSIKIEKKVTATVWRFTGTNSSEILQADKWEQGASSDASCENNPSEPLPCQYTVADQNISDSDELMEYFETTYPLNTASEIRDHADSQKPETL